MFKNFKIDAPWKNTLKFNLIFCLILSLMFYFALFILIASFTNKNSWNIDKSFYLLLFFLFHIVFISYSLSIFIVNSNEIQQQKYQFLWLFLFLISLNLIGFIGILMLINLQKWKKNNITFKFEKKATIIKNEKWFMLWAIYSSIGIMIFIIPIPLSIINLINIKKNWKKEEIDIKELKKNAYFSSDIILMIVSKFAF